MNHKYNQFGDVAQLGEHQVRNLGVEGSIPFVSTIEVTGQADAWPFLFISYYFIGGNSRKKAGHREI